MKFFFLLTPFFVLSMFLAMTRDYTDIERRRTAVRVAFSVFMTCTVLFFFGSMIFRLFDITLDAFRIGGSLLFISAVKLVNGAADNTTSASHTAISGEDIAKLFYKNHSSFRWRFL